MQTKLSIAVSLGAICAGAVLLNSYQPSLECQKWHTLLDDIDNIRISLLSQWEEVCAPLCMNLSEKLRQGLPAYNYTGPIETRCNEMVQESLKNMRDFKNISTFVSKHCT